MIKYPYLDKWISEQGIPLRKIAALFEMSYSSLCKLIEGKTNPKKDTIDKILSITGMKYEKVFAEKVIEGE